MSKKDVMSSCNMFNAKNMNKNVTTKAHSVSDVINKDPKSFYKNINFNAPNFTW
jgi:hypothetical protein